MFNSIYYVLLITFFFMSICFVYYGINKKKSIGLIEIFTILSWFYIFYRPLTLEICLDVININLYFWDASYYSLGTVLSASALLLFQAGSILAIRKKHCKIYLSNNQIEVNVFLAKKFLIFSFSLYITLLILLALIYGQNLLESLGSGCCFGCASWL